MARELEQFLGRGNEKVFWIFSLKNAGGAIAGAYIGSRIGQTLGSGIIVFLSSVLFLALGLALTLDIKGVMLSKRWLIAIKFFIGKTFNQHKPINAQEWYEVVEIKEQPIVYRKSGETILAPRENEK